MQVQVTKVGCTMQEQVTKMDNVPQGDVEVPLEQMLPQPTFFASLSPSSSPSISHGAAARSPPLPSAH